MPSASDRPRDDPLGRDDEDPENEHRPRAVRLSLRYPKPAAANPAALPYHATMEAYRALEAELARERDRNHCTFDICWLHGKNPAIDRAEKAETRIVELVKEFAKEREDLLRQTAHHARNHGDCRDKEYGFFEWQLVGGRESGEGREESERHGGTIQRPSQAANPAALRPVGYKQHDGNCDGCCQAADEYIRAIEAGFAAQEKTLRNYMSFIKEAETLKAENERMRKAAHKEAKA